MFLSTTEQEVGTSRPKRPGSIFSTITLVQISKPAPFALVSPYEWCSISIYHFEDAIRLLPQILRGLPKRCCQPFLPNYHSLGAIYDAPGSYVDGHSPSAPTFSSGTRSRLLPQERRSTLFEGPLCGRQVPRG